jgi:serine O-acetyltransferase/putative colanic acid biosynthesis acetyltransferase WcaB
MAKWIDDSFQDWRANGHDLRIQVILAMFRVGHALRKSKARLPFFYYPYAFIYKVLVQWFFNVELPLKVEIGPKFRIYHGQGLVVHANSRIGAGVTLRHGVTVGSKVLDGDGVEAPVLEDGVNVGCDAIILGDIVIGAGAKIGAGSVVTKDVPPGAVAFGNPARIRPPAKPEAKLP